MKMNELVRSFGKRLFKCHWIIFFVAFIFTFFFGNFLSIDKPINGYIFSGLIIVGYGFFLYSESVIEARKNFYNANGKRDILDLYLGFKGGLYGHILTFVLMIAIFCFYYSYQWFGVSIWIGDVPIHIYLNTIFRFWLLPFLSFFPASDMVIPWLYLLFALFPSIVCGFSYIRGLYECKTIQEIENSENY